jgi:hypothetical protein
VRRNPRKARFPAQPEMRPNEVLQKPPVSVIILQVEALYTEAIQYKSGVSLVFPPFVQ